MKNYVKGNELGEQALTLHWSDGSDSEFDYLWLRDNCPTSFHPSTHERNFNLLSIANDLHIQNIKVNDNSLKIIWSDDHESIYLLKWLSENDYSKTQEIASESNFQNKSWDKEYGENIYETNAEQLIHDEGALLDWMVNLQNKGLVLVKNMPEEPYALEKIAKLMSHLRETNFGLTFDVESKPNPNNQAYTSEALPLHTDLPNQELPPGYQFLHCLNNESEGGESVFVDGFAVSEKIRGEYPEEFILLSETPIPFRFHDGTHDLLEEKPVIVCSSGEIREINYNAHIATTFCMSKDRMRPYYLAYRHFMELLNDPDYTVQFKLNSREMVVFDNRRVLHGRGRFNPSTGKRHLRGCYIDRGDLKSKIRILNKKIS